MMFVFQTIQTQKYTKNRNTHTCTGAHKNIIYNNIRTLKEATIKKVQH
jgi:hypothetical protein